MVLSIIGIAFAAFCVWLTVRIVNRRERWAKRLAAGLGIGLPVLYVASFGPACWLNERTSKEFILTTGMPDPGSFWDGGIGTRAILLAYKPLIGFADERPGWRRRLFRWYAEVGTRNASLRLGGDDITWYRLVPASMVIDETGTYVPRRAEETKP